MGRYLARVPLDFSHPLDTPWGGYENPHPYADDCPHCGGSGLTPEANVIYEIWYAHQSSEEHLPPGRAPKVEYSHPAVQRYSRWQVMRSPEFYRHSHETLQEAVDREAKRLCEVCYNDSIRYRLTDEEIRDMQRAGLFKNYFRRTFPKLARRPRSKKRRIINKWHKNPKNWAPKEVLRNGEQYQPWEWVQLKQPRMTRDRLIEMLVFEGFSNVFEQYAFLRWWCKRHNITMHCPHCQGNGHIWASREAEDLYESWSPTDPPKGDGYQIWNDTSDDMPVTPVFDTLEGVCEWAANNGVSIFGGRTATKEQWMAQFQDKDAVMVEEKLENGIMLVFT